MHSSRRAASFVSGTIVDSDRSSSQPGLFTNLFARFRNASIPIGYRWKSKESTFSEGEFFALCRTWRYKTLPAICLFPGHNISMAKRSSVLRGKTADDTEAYEAGFVAYSPSCESWRSPPFSVRPSESLHITHSFFQSLFTETSGIYPIAHYFPESALYFSRYLA